MFPIDEENIEKDNRESLVYYSKLYLQCLGFNTDKEEKVNYEKFHNDFSNNIYKEDKTYTEKDVEEHFSKIYVEKLSKIKGLPNKINFLHDLCARVSYKNEMENLDRRDLYRMQKNQVMFADNEEGTDYKAILATCKNIGKILNNENMLKALILKSGKNVPVKDFKLIVENSFNKHNLDLLEKREDYMTKLMKYEVDIYKTKYINSLENNAKTL